MTEFSAVQTRLLICDRLDCPIHRHRTTPAALVYDYYDETKVSVCGAIILDQTAMVATGIYSVVMK